MKDKLNSINNIPFLFSLGILLLNDFYFKEEYHNWLTGKLSDVCGLYVFAAFWSALLPGKKRLVYFVVAILFVVWKSSYSQAFIDFFSENAFRIHRVVDASDLIALVALPFAFRYHPEKSLQLKTNPIPIAILCLFSFCATSVPTPTKIFTHPQYVLFRSGIVNIKTTEDASRFYVYHLDTLDVVLVKRIEIKKPAAIDDDFHKTQILADIDLRLLKESRSDYRTDKKLDEYATLRDSLTVNGRVSITINLDSVIDQLNFKGTRLDGYFIRSKNDQVVIEGRYKNGLEDSVWRFYDENREVITQKYFRKGELIKTERFENGKLVDAQTHATRNDIISNKYIQITIIVLFMVVLVAKLISNYRKSGPDDIIKVSPLQIGGGILVLPLAVLLLAKSVSVLIPHSYSDFFGVFGELVLVYIVTGPLFLLAFIFLGLRSKFDLIFYVLVFSLAVILVEELFYLETIMP